AKRAEDRLVGRVGASRHGRCLQRMVKLAHTEAGIELIEPTQHRQHAIGDARLELDRRPADRHPFGAGALVHSGERGAVFGHRGALLALERSNSARLRPSHGASATSGAISLLRMCTLIVAVRHFPRLPLLVAANRDERYDRPASAVHRWAGERFVAPRDDEAGGTWLGVNDQGLFVGITNRSGAVKDDARESRGVLVVEALRAASASGLHASLAALRAERFNAFHLHYVDTRAAFVTIG